MLTLQNSCWGIPICLLSCNIRDIINLEKLVAVIGNVQLLNDHRHPPTQWTSRQDLPKPGPMKIYPNQGPFMMGFYKTCSYLNCPKPIFNPNRYFGKSLLRICPAKLMCQIIQLWDEEIQIWDVKLHLHPIDFQKM